MKKLRLFLTVTGNNYCINATSQENISPQTFMSGYKSKKGRISDAINSKDLNPKDSKEISIEEYEMMAPKLLGMKNVGKLPRELVCRNNSTITINIGGK